MVVGSREEVEASECRKRLTCRDRWRASRRRQLVAPLPMECRPASRISNLNIYLEGLAEIHVSPGRTTGARAEIKRCTCAETREVRRWLEREN